MSAHYFGSEVKRTKRYDMGRRVGNHARNLLIMTATPHNAKDEDFQRFMALLDEDRFAGQQKDAVHRSDPTDLMRRLVKEDLYTFAGTKLFPERRSYTAEYELSEPENVLYEKVTEYVREEMNRADRNAQAEGGGSPGCCSVWSMGCKTAGGTAMASNNSSPTGCSSWRSIARARWPLPAPRPTSTTGP
jgi:hypothetical protein